MSDYTEDRALKQKWMKDHGYTLLGGIYDIQIAILNHAGNEGETATFKHMISLERVYEMTIEELELYDRDVWLKARGDISKLIAIKNKRRDTL